MRVLELPKPLLPLNPVLAPQQPRLPRALGEVFIGNPRLKLPELQAQAPRDLPALKAQEAPAPKAEDAAPFSYTVDAAPTKTTGTGLGQQVDLKV